MKIGRAVNIYLAEIKHDFKIHVVDSIMYSDMIEGLISPPLWCNWGSDGAVMLALKTARTGVHFYGRGDLFAGG